ncbi:MAG: type II toxin-antitoxin system prevent-host-death family antitoxin [Phenylobacterium sp.]|uniref:type II toxin-antitoxin system Phd/YefM family antitoxin n=1 Tax=Phenylobacterium sp. TaxID=1871053 RepID=UPI00272774B4|nr:type II toxin-antitoxin system prevent-host-death family antitoxin [Phenylobacterium sp.]MDO8408940.1 type II toxin-antitoxin system prevent-host-death family antitoxin [Phenylobacterium sp.]
MSAVDLAEAKARLSELIDRAETGEAIEITRGGKRVAWLTTDDRPRRPVRLADLQALTRSLPPSTETAADLVRAMRDSNCALGFSTQLPA